MASNSLVSDPVDPLQSQFGVSLFSRTIRVPPPPEPKDLESIHQIMKSVNTLSSPEKVVEEAKAIVDGGSKLLESAYPKFMESVGIEWDSFALEGKENVQERRPGLGCKRARFTLKTNASTRPPAILEPTLDFEQPCDAEAFFNAFEKAEEAKRELQRLNGGTISDFNKHDQPINTRSRRPGILGYRKSYVYKHRDSSENNSQIVSQDTQELNLLASPSYETQKDKADTEFEAQEPNVSGIATETEEGYKGILEELFSKNSEDLDGNGAVSILEERLSIKPISLDTFSMPGLNVGRMDFMAMREKLPKENKTLTNISSLARRLSGGDTHVKQKRVGGSPISPITSPTSPNVTVGTISLMKKRSSLCSPLRDPFSPLNLDLSEPKKAFAGDDIDKQPPQLPVRKELGCSGNLEPQVEDELGRPTDDSVELQTGVPRASESPIDCFLVKNMEPRLEDELRRSTTSRVDLQTMISRALDSPDGHCLDKSLGQGNIDEDIWPRASQGDVTECGSGDGVRENTAEESINLAIAPDRNSENVTDRSEAAVLPSQFNSHADDSTQTVQQSHEPEGIPLKVAGHANPEVNVSKLQTAENESGHLLDGQPNTAAIEDNHADVPSITADIMTMKTSQKVQPKKAMTKRPRGESRELKALPRRKSLAEAGTYFESGVRRSKRIKTRPLEYWNGERLLYGRIDESIKLVGLKYISPSKGERNLKVKAYISDEYKEIIDLASRH